MKTFFSLLLLSSSMLLLSGSKTLPDNLVYLQLDSGEIVSLDRNNEQFLNCLCRCYQVGQFSCSYNETKKGRSPSCSNLENGPCICEAYGCFRKPLPTDGECFQKCQSQYGKTVARKNNQPLSNLGSLLDIYDQNTDQFSHCQDLAYAAIFGKAPAKNNIEKANIPKGLKAAGYQEVDKGFVPKAQTKVDLNLKDGDILLLDFNKFPEEGNAAHYAVYFEGSIYQILHYQTGGVLSPVADVSYFFKKRVLVRPDRKVLRPHNIYQYYRIYRR